MKETKKYYIMIILAVVYLLTILWARFGGEWSYIGIRDMPIWYHVFCFYIFIPITELLCGIAVGKNSNNRYKWRFSLTGLLNTPVAYVALNIAFHYNPWESILNWFFIDKGIIGFIVALVGVFIGSYYAKHHHAKEVKKA